MAASDNPSIQLVPMLTQSLGRADLTPASFDCSRTKASLRGKNVYCPPLTRRFIERQLGFSFSV